MTTNFETAFLAGDTATDTVSSLLTQIPQTASVMQNVMGAAKYVQTPEFREQVQDIRTEVSDTAILLAALFTLSTVFAGVQCFIAVANYRKG